MGEKQTRTGKKKETVTDDAAQQMMREVGDLWSRFFQEQMASFGQTVSSGAARSFFTEAGKSEFRNRWQNFIREEMARCFQVNPIGPLRQYQEKTIHFVRAFAEWEAACTEFCILMNRPMEASFLDVEEKIRRESRTGGSKIPGEDLFPLWIDALERRYMDLYRSEEFMTALGKTLNAGTSVTKAREGLMEDVLKSLHMPTPRDMDELYREIHLLRKRVETLEAQRKGSHGRTR